MSQGFDESTAVVHDGPGRWRAAMDPGWWVLRGPNGGYVAAVILRALTGAVDDPLRAPRSLTVHYLAPPAEGPVEIVTRIERSGRSLTSASARMEQGGRTVALALAAFSVAWPAAHDFAELTPPEADAPESGEILVRPESAPPIAQRWEFRAPIGAPPFSGSDRALAGGWIRLRPPRTADPYVIAAMTDAWFPAAFSRMTEPAGLPTVDLTIHFRAPLPVAGAGPDDWYLTEFRSGWSREGFVEEDGEIWSRDGVLLAQSRQLALTI